MRTAPANNSARRTKAHSALDPELLPFLDVLAEMLARALERDEAARLTHRQPTPTNEKTQR